MRYPTISNGENHPLTGSCIPCRVLDCAVFNGLAPRTVSGMGDVVIQREFRAGSQLELNGALADRVAVVAVGSVRIQWALDDGRRYVLGFCFKGDVLQLPSRDPGVKAIAITNGILYLVERSFFGRCREKNRGVDQWELAVARENLEGMAAQSLLLGRLSAEERMCLFLLDLADRIGTTTEFGVALTLPMNREDIADHLGLKSETVSRQFSRMKTTGLVRLPKPGKVIIPDTQELIDRVPYGLSSGEPSAFMVKRDRSVA